MTRREVSEEERRFRAANGWPGPLVCARFAADGLAAQCDGRLHIQVRSRQLRCQKHCDGGTHCNKPEDHKAVSP